MNFYPLNSLPDFLLKRKEFFKTMAKNLWRQIFTQISKIWVKNIRMVCLQTPTNCIFPKIQLVGVCKRWIGGLIYPTPRFNTRDVKNFDVYFGNFAQMRGERSEASMVGNRCFPYNNISKNFGVKISKIFPKRE